MQVRILVQMNNIGQSREVPVLNPTNAPEIAKVVAGHVASDVRSKFQTEPITQIGVKVIVGELRASVDINGFTDGGEKVRKGLTDVVGDLAYQAAEMLIKHWPERVEQANG